MSPNGVSISRRTFLRTSVGGTGLAGAATGTAAAQEGGGDTETVELGDYYFRPGTEEPLYITPGTTVKFVWKTGGHNIHVDSQPEGANWQGHEPIEDAGFTYTHTFDVKGEYHYWCVPHKSLGMIADLVVNDTGGPPGGGGGGGPSVPSAAKTLAIGTTVALGGVLSLSYIFLKYGATRRGPNGEG